MIAGYAVLTYMSESLERRLAQALIDANVAGWGTAGLTVEAISVSSSSNTEWHKVFFVTCEGGLQHRKLVVTLPSWRGAALNNKERAALHLASTKIGPQVLGPSNLTLDGAPVHVAEWLPGGELDGGGLVEAMQELGTLYARLHGSGHDWFEASSAALQAEGLLAPGAQNASWASCVWILSWLHSLVPSSNRSALEAAGVQWEALAAEIAALPDSTLLPCSLAATATIHGDSHMGNVLRDASGALRLIDFDMTCAGPVGSELGFLALMLFRCGFGAADVLPRDAQRRFASGYLRERDGAAAASDDAALDDFLLAVHAWSYVGLLKMGLLCAVLMSNEGHEQKREVMRARAPVLLHPAFLGRARDAVRAALVGEERHREAILERGLFHHADTPPL